MLDFRVLKANFCKKPHPQIVVILDTPSALLKRHGYKVFNLLIAYRRAEYVPNKAAELIPTAKPIIKPTLTRSKQLGCGGRCILVSWVELSYEYERSKGILHGLKKALVENLLRRESGKDQQCACLMLWGAAVRPLCGLAFGLRTERKQETSEGKEYRMDRAIFIDKRIPDKWVCLRCFLPIDSV